MKSTKELYKSSIRRNINKRNSDQYGQMYTVLLITLIKLGIPDSKCHQLIFEIFRIITTQEDETLAVIKIAKCLKEFDQLISKTISIQDTKRAQWYFENIRPFLPHDQSVLDFGCGNGLIGSLIGQTNSIFLFDPCDYRAESAKQLSFSDQWKDVNQQKFDTTLAVTVFHHSDNPTAQLHKIKKLTQRLIVIESVLGNILSYEVQALADWFYNRCLHPKASIPVPGNFYSIPIWESEFAEHGFKITVIKDLGIDQPLVPEQHVLFVLEK
ncbi:methyltransferase domain-containing protein [Patescibacteria group bacterium]